jgi:hypothetical protein
LQEPFNRAGVGSVLGLLFDPKSFLLEEIDDCIYVRGFQALAEEERGSKHTGGSDDLALLLGLVDTLEAAKEQLSSVDDSQVDAEMLVKGLLDLFALVQTHDSCKSVRAT